MRQRQCVVHRFYEDLTVDQIASQLGMPVYSELLFAIASMEPFGALAISVATLSMVVTLWLWGGPVARTVSEETPDPDTETEE